jgi:hypothetical protein
MSKLLPLISPFLLLAIVVASPLGAQPTAAPSGDLRLDLRTTPTASLARFGIGPDTLGEPRAPERKSLWIAGGLSAIFPGSGQVYAEAPLWRSLLYGLLEGAGWTVYAIAGARGSEATDEFQSYADAHWSVERYIDWIAANVERWSPSGIDAEAARDALRRVYISDDHRLPAWERIDRAQLNRLERSVTGGFSHTLPAPGEQQYYEEIGKYAQYRAGWDDHDPAGDSLVYDPDRTTRNNRLYMDKRAEANSYLGVAAAAGSLILLNHVASMLDAVLAARSYNVSVTAGLEGRLIPIEGTTPMLEMTPRLQVVVRF